MKSVGIINFHRANNYGAVLQAYAIMRAVSNLGYRAEIIDFIPEALILNYQAKTEFRKLVKQLGILRATRSFIKRLPGKRVRAIRERLFTEMREEFLILSREKYSAPEDLRKNPPKYDAYITGSDQVWNPSMKKARGDSYFLDFVDDGFLKVSYAASIAEPVPSDLVNEYARLIKRFDFISVREKSAKEFLRPLVEKDIEVTLDPTLLLSEKEWAELMKNNPVNSKYILVYDLARSKMLTQGANEISLKTRYPIVSFSSSRNYRNGLYSFASSSPGEFLSLIRDAEVVLSSSFHGVAFSVVFGKPFLAFASNKRSSRIVDFLELLEVEDRIVDDNTSIEIIANSPIDYVKTRKLLESEREKSIQFLKNALSSLER